MWRTYATGIAERCSQLFKVLAGLMVAICASPARADDAKLLSYGRHLASECSGCHRIDGVDNGIPSITGWPSRSSFHACGPGAERGW